MGSNPSKSVLIKTMDLLKNYLAEAVGWTRDKFASVWNELASRQDVAEYFGISPEHASVIANQLRKLGYELKKHVRGAKKGSTRAKSPPQGTLPPKSIVLKMWNSDPSITRLSQKLGIPSDALKRILIQLKDEGEKVSVSAPRGRKPRNVIDPKIFAVIWQRSERLDDVIEKLKEMGYEIPDETGRSFVTSFAHRINKARRARGMEDLKKLERKAYYKALKFADEQGLESQPEEEVSDIEGFADEPGFDDFEQEPSAEDDPWAEDTIPGDENEEMAQEPREFDEPGETDSDKEFENVWNNAESLRDVLKNLRELGWELSKEEVKSKARVLRFAGIQLKKFE